MRARIKKLDTEVPVCDYDHNQGWITWYDNQMTREDPPSKLFEMESIKDVEITSGDTSKDYKCELWEKCIRSEGLTCLKSK